MKKRSALCAMILFIVLAACENGNVAGEPPVIPDIPPLPYPQGSPPAAVGTNPYETGGGGASVNRTYFDQAGISVVQAGYILTIQGAFGRIEYDVSSGLAGIFRKGDSTPALNSIYAEAEINDWPVRTFALTRDNDSVHVHTIKDSFGEGVRVTVRSWGGRIIIWQNYYIYPSRNYLVFDMVAELTRFGPARTNYIAPLKAGKDGETVEVMPLTTTGTDMRFLAVPFDNDEYARFNARPVLGADSESYEVTAVYDNTNRRGFIAGSVSHDTWKSGIRLHRNTTRVHQFYLFNGITSYHTRDTEIRPGNYSVLGSQMGNIIPEADVPDLMPHGIITGINAASSKMFFAFYNVWLDGMEEYGRTNALVVPALYWAHGVPFGWNHWSAVGSQITYELYTDAADFINDNLPTFNNGTDGAFINFDSYWTRLSETERRQAADHVRRLGMTAGIYHTPFTTWLDTEDWLKSARVEGAEQYTWFDVVLKDFDGRPLRFMGNKGWPLDPTHPGTIAHNDLMVRRFREWGFSYIKLDFMTHGTMEGDFYNKTITTGKQAYSYGMQKYLESIGRELTRGNFFLGLSIAPIFPHQFAHARRISCDVFGYLGQTEYMLNSLTYGWWMHDTIYRFNDTDSIVVYTSFNANANDGLIYTENEGLSRYIAAAISGGLVIFGEHIQQAEAAQRVKDLMNNPRVNALAASSRTFRPVEGDTGSITNDHYLFVRDDRDIDDSLYLAVFNVRRNPSGADNRRGRPSGGTRSLQVNLERIGLNANTDYMIDDVITGARIGPVKDSIPISMAQAQPFIYRFTVHQP